MGLVEKEQATVLLKSTTLHINDAQKKMFVYTQHEISTFGGMEISQGKKRYFFTHCSLSCIVAPLAAS